RLEAMHVRTTARQYVYGAMKLRGASTPADRTTAPQEDQAEEREGRTPLDRPSPAVVSGSGRTPQCPSNERWSPVTLTRSSHPSPSHDAGADTTTRRTCR